MCLTLVTKMSPVITQPHAFIRNANNAQKPQKKMSSDKKKKTGWTDMIHRAVEG